MAYNARVSRKRDRPGKKRADFPSRIRPVWEVGKGSTKISIQPRHQRRLGSSSNPPD